MFNFSVTLRPKRCSLAFQGFLIQARLADDNSTVVGSFASPGHGDSYQLSSCAIQEVSTVNIEISRLQEFSIKK